jgi:hypothetical protein
MRKVGLALAFVLAVATGANAAVIYDFNSITPGPGGTFFWNYNARLDANQKVDSSIAPNFGTIFDFFGATGASSVALVPGITATSFLEATSTQAAFQSVPDSPSVPNVRTTITGSFTPPPGVNTLIYMVQVTSTVDGPPTLGPTQSAQVIKNVPGDPSNNTVTGNSVRIEGPGPVVIPEPGTLLLLGTGFVGLGGYARRRLRRK